MSAAIILGPIIHDEPIQQPVENRHGVGRTLDPTLSAIAREIAMDIRELEDIIADYGWKPDSPAWVALRDSREFSRMLQEAISDWNAANSTAKRVKIKAAASLEASLPALHGIIHNVDAAAPARITAVQTMAKLAGIESGIAPVSGTGGAASGFTLNINIGQGRGGVSLTSPRPVIDVDGDE